MTPASASPGPASRTRFILLRPPECGRILTVRDKFCRRKIETPAENCAAPLEVLPQTFAKSKENRLALLVRVLIIRTAKKSAGMGVPARRERGESAGSPLIFSPSLALRPAVGHRVRLPGSAGSAGGE